MVRKMVLLSAVLLAGCGGVPANDAGGGGGAGGGSGGSSGGGSSGGSSSSSFTCCINDTYYKCPDQASFDRCANFGSPDTKGCVRQAGACPSSGGGGGSGGTSGGGSGSTGGSGGSGGGSGGGSSGASVGAQCQKNSDCTSNSCLISGSAQFGYCTKICESFADCPTFWDCKNVGNASATYCVQ